MLKYIRVDEKERQKMQVKWNQPVTWPLFVVALFLIALVLPGVIAYRRRQNATARRET
jgi:lipopolysaccharide export LptBFGC system permease protein LptF